MQRQCDEENRFADRDESPYELSYAQAVVTMLSRSGVGEHAALRHHDAVGEWRESLRATCERPLALRDPTAPSPRIFWYEITLNEKQYEHPHSYDAARSRFASSRKGNLNLTP